MGVAAGVRAFASGILTVLRAPLLIAAVYLALLGATLPFAALLAQQLSTAMARTHPEREVPEGIDAEWWLEFRRHATGIATTFTPAVIGFAAPLENLSAVLDRTPRPWFLIGPVAIYGLLSAWLWGGMIARLQQRRALGWRAFAARSRAAFARVLGVNLVAISAVIVAYVSAHPILFGVAYPIVSGVAASDTGQFAIRVAMYAVFAALLGFLSVFADYARIIAALDDRASVPGAYIHAWRMLRVRCGAVVTVVALVVLCFGLLLAVYGFVELQGGARVGGWRAVALAQAFVLGRVGLRVVNAAAQVGVASPAAA